MNQENQPATKKCPFCKEEILADAVKCRHCGEWLNKPLGVQRAQATVEQYSNAQAPWQLIVLSIITFGIYEIYWFYRNWKHFNIHNTFAIRPDWRTIGLFVPILNIILIYEQVRDIRYLAMKAGCKTDYSPGWLTFGYMLLNGLCGYILWKSAKLYINIWSLVIGFLAVCLLVIVQKTLNDYWKKEQPELEMRPKFSGGEIALLVIGGIFWILSLIGTFIPSNL